MECNSRGDLGFYSRQSGEGRDARPGGVNRKRQRTGNAPATILRPEIVFPILKIGEMTPVSGIAQELSRQFYCLLRQKDGATSVNPSEPVHNGYRGAGEDRLLLTSHSNFKLPSKTSFHLYSNSCFDTLFSTSPLLSHSFAPPGHSLNRYCFQCLFSPFLSTLTLFLPYLSFVT